MKVKFECLIMSTHGEVYFLKNKEYEVIEETEHAVRMITELGTPLFIPKLNDSIKIIL